MVGVLGHDVATASVVLRRGVPLDQLDGIVHHLHIHMVWTNLVRVRLVVLIERHPLLLLLVLYHILQSLQFTLLGVLHLLLLLSLLLELLEDLLLFLVEFHVLLVVLDEVDHLHVRVHLTVDALRLGVSEAFDILWLAVHQLAVVVHGDVLLVGIGACSCLVVVALVVDTVIEVSVVVDLVLLVDVAHSWAKFDDAPRLDEGLDAVGEHEVIALAILVQVALCGVEGSQDDALGLAVLEDAVLGGVELVLGEEVLR